MHRAGKARPAWSPYRVSGRAWGGDDHQQPTTPGSRRCGLHARGTCRGNAMHAQLRGHVRAWLQGQAWRARARCAIRADAGAMVGATRVHVHRRVRRRCFLRLVSISSCALRTVSYSYIMNSAARIAAAKMTENAMVILRRVLATDSPFSREFQAATARRDFDALGRLTSEFVSALFDCAEANPASAAELARIRALVA